MSEQPSQKPATPVAKTTTRSAKPFKPSTAKSDQSAGPIKVIALGLFCFVLSFLGAWAALASGLVENENVTITEKRDAVMQEGDVFAELVDDVAPSVVSIVTESQYGFGFSSYSRQGAGTGIVISKEGYILTNKHVIAGAQAVQVVLSDGTAYEDVRVIGEDPANDIAFLKITEKVDLKPAVIGDSSKVEVGEKVLAIGNALGQFQNSVTSGIISGIGRPIVAGGGAGGDVERLSNLLQTDAAINPGNSGGPLVDMEGRVIGINTAVSQDAEGIGFAIPINDAKGLIESVTETGRLERAFLGVTHINVTDAIAKEFDLAVDYGAYVVNEQGDAVAAGSPASRAGLQEGDVITKVGNKKLGATNPLLSAISVYRPGDTVEITYLRDGSEKTATVTLADYPRS